MRTRRDGPAGRCAGCFEQAIVYGMTQSAAISTHGLTKRFGPNTAVDDITMAVPAGQAVGLLGHNGAGKTTLIRLLLGLIRSDSGHVELFGQRLDRSDLSPLTRVGAMVEEPRFHPHLSGRENLQVVAAVRGCHAPDRVEQALSRVGLDRDAQRMAGTYSQGMRQRLGIARCLLADPGLLILDEPANGLDPSGIVELRRLITDLVDEGRTVLLSSHQLTEVARTCETVAIVDHGRLVWQGPVENPDALEARFFGVTGQLRDSR